VTALEEVLSECLITIKLWHPRQSDLKHYDYYLWMTLKQNLCQNSAFFLRTGRWYPKRNSHYFKLKVPLFVPKYFQKNSLPMQ